MLLAVTLLSFFFFFNDTATTEIYTLSLHDALPISRRTQTMWGCCFCFRITTARRASNSTKPRLTRRRLFPRWRDRKSTRLNSSHGYISYAVFCLKKKKIQVIVRRRYVDRL